MFPVTLDWISEEDELAKAFCSTDIITSPGIRNAVYITPCTFTCPSSTWEKISR